MLATAPLIESEAGGADTGVSPGDEALNGFLLAVGDYYRIPQKEIIIIRERGIPPYEIPVALFIAKRAAPIAPVNWGYTGTSIFLPIISSVIVTK